MKILQEDITTFTGDAVVNAANSQLTHGGGVDGAIREQAGDELNKTLARTGYLAEGTCLITFPFNLPCGAIIHTVAPVYHSQSIYEVFLKTCYTSCLDTAWKMGCRSIAFPLLGTGAFGWPLKRGAEIAIRALTRFEQDNSLDITLYAYTKEAYREANLALEVNASRNEVK